MFDMLRLIVSSLVLPPGGPLVLLLLGLLCLRRCPRLGRSLAAVGVTTLWLGSLPIVADALVTALEGATPLDLEAAATADAIVIPGGGVRSQALEYGGDTLGRLTLERVRYGAYLARRTGLPVLVTGGPPEPGIRAESELMREALEDEYRVAVRWADNRARNTRENASQTAKLLGAEGKRKVVLVLHGFDVRRARRAFEDAGLQVIAAPTHVPRWDGVELQSLLPDARALATTHYALYEVLALVRDRLGTHVGGR